MNESATPTVAGRRGRKYRPPVDTTPLRATHGADQTRLAWLIGTHRISAFDGAYSHRGDLLKALRAHTTSVAWDDSGVSRWESGARIPGRDVLAAYESVLGLTDRSLHAVAYTLEDTRQRIPRPRTNRRVEHLLAELMDATLEGDPTGPQWLAFAEVLLEHGPIFARAGAWEAPLAKLVVEFSRSRGADYLTRRSAIQLLLTHPTMASHMLTALEEVANSIVTPRRADVASLFQFADPAVATGHAMRLFYSNVAADHFAARRVVSALIARGDLDENFAAEIGAICAADLADNPAAYVSAQIVALMPGKVGADLRTVLSTHPAVEQVILSGEAIDPSVSGPTAAFVAQVALAAAPPALRRDSDPMLERLIREAFSHFHSERSAQAGYVLMMSAYADSVAAACATTIGDLDPRMHATVSSLMRGCAGNDHLPLLLDLLSHANETVRINALAAIGNLPLELDEAAHAAIESATATLSAEAREAAAFAVAERLASVSTPTQA